MKRPLSPRRSRCSPLAGCALELDDAGGGNDLDNRGAAIACLKQKDSTARATGRERRSVSATADRPRIKFFLTAGEAEAEQFQGRGEGAEQIGSALLFVGEASDDQHSSSRSRTAWPTCRSPPRRSPRCRAARASAAQTSHVVAAPAERRLRHHHRTSSPSRPRQLEGVADGRDPPFTATAMSRRRRPPPSMLARRRAWA